ncbi:hypothetical protein SSX86_003261 [Deinandra increscens subsp. villosa]|uniref:Uncharacterized protein n=1 Tax=Deinandra increscens subsp. villosa TaxID=3103831 RepID=A0AAP0DLN2_9ASTR
MPAAKAFNLVPYNYNNNNISKKNSGGRLVLCCCSDDDDDECPTGPNYPSNLIEDALRFKEADIRYRRKANAELRWAINGLYKIYKREYEEWDEKQFLLVGAAVYAAWHALQTFLVGIVVKDMLDPILPLGFLQKLVPSDYKPMVDSFRGSPLQFGCNLAIYRGVYALIAYIMMKRLSRAGKQEENLISSMVAGLGSGVIISLVTGLRGANAILVGLINAPICALAFKVISF